MLSTLVSDSIIEEFDRKYGKSSQYNVLLAFDATIVTCNDKFEKMIGYSKEELHGKSCFDLITPKELDKAEKAFQNLSDARKLDLIEFDIKKRDGSSETSFWVSQEFYDENLKPVAFLSTGTLQH